MQWVRPEMMMVLAGGSALNNFLTQNVNGIPAMGHTDAPTCPFFSSTSLSPLVCSCLPSLVNNGRGWGDFEDQLSSWLSFPFLLSP